MQDAGCRMLETPVLNPASGTLHEHDIQAAASAACEDR